MKLNRYLEKILSNMEIEKIQDSDYKKIQELLQKRTNELVEDKQVIEKVKTLTKEEDYFINRK